MRASFSLFFVVAMAHGCADTPADGHDDVTSCTVPPGTADAGACEVACRTSQIRDPSSGRCKTVCRIDVEADNRAPGEKTVDCGNLPVSATNAERETAQRCLLAAVASGRPVKLIMWMQGTDSQVAYAYVSAGAGGTMTMLSFDSNFSGFSSFGGGAISKQTCSAFRAQSDCQISATSSCISCADESEHSKVCEVPKADSPR